MRGRKRGGGRGAGLKTGVTYRCHPGIFTGRQMPITREMKWRWTPQRSLLTQYWLALMRCWDKDWKKARRRQGTEEGGGGGGGKSFVSCSRRDNSCQNEASATWLSEVVVPDEGVARPLLRFLLRVTSSPLKVVPWVDLLIVIKAGRRSVGILDEEQRMALGYD